MKRTLFATTALAALAVGGAASAQGIALFGTARLGLGYNINSDGAIITDPDDPRSESLVAVSRVRFGVNMTGETDSGITFGATIRADNAIGGEAAEGQTDGNVFVSGAFGTLTYGDTNGADEQWVGDVPGNYSLTGLGDQHETPFLTNGGDFQNIEDDEGARPTVRYDFDIAGFGASLSTNRDLTDIAVGAGYAADFGGGSWTLGAGYAEIDGFTETQEVLVDTVVPCDLDEDGVIDVGEFCTVGVNVEESVTFQDITTWSVGAKADYEQFGFGVTWISIDADTLDASVLTVGASAGFDRFTVGGWYTLTTDVSADTGDTALDDELEDELDGSDGYGLSAEYDLGGGAQVAGGVAKVRGFDNLDTEDIVADFGIKMDF